VYQIFTSWIKIEIKYPRKIQFAFFAIFHTNHSLLLLSPLVHYYCIAVGENIKTE